jgi:hypothetical protein
MKSLPVKDLSNLTINGLSLVVDRFVVDEATLEHNSPRISSVFPC